MHTQELTRNTYASLYVCSLVQLYVAPTSFNLDQNVFIRWQKLMILLSRIAWCGKTFIDNVVWQILSHWAPAYWRRLIIYDKGAHIWFYPSSGL